MEAIDAGMLQEALYVGIDVNLSGLAITYMGYRGIRQNWIPINHRDKTLNELVLEWRRATIELYHDMVGMVKAGAKVTVVIEDPAGMGGPWQTAAHLNKIIGMLAMVFAEADWRLALPSSMTWKKRTIGEGNASKEDVQAAMSKLLYPLGEGYIENHHIADSTAMAYYGYLEDR